MSVIERSDLEQPVPSGTPGLIPVQYSQEIIQEAIKSSLALSTFRQVRMPTRVQNLPVLDVLPQATWVTGEPSATDGTGGEKSETTQEWDGVVLTAEEIAAIVIIPEAVVEDSTQNLWAEITPRLGESIGAAVDAASFFGTNAPTSWPTGGIHAAAVAAGNTHTAASPTSDDYNTAMGLVEADGFMARQIYAPLTEKANYRSWSAAGVPTYLTDLRDDRRVDRVFGVEVAYAENGMWDGAKAVSIIGDPTKAIVGTRLDMQARLLREATITIAGGSVNLAQQDSVALRVRARFGFAVANPVTLEQPTAANRYPFAVISPT